MAGFLFRDSEVLGAFSKVLLGDGLEGVLEYAASILARVGKQDESLGFEKLAGERLERRASCVVVFVLCGREW